MIFLLCVYRTPGPAGVFVPKLFCELFLLVATAKIRCTAMSSPGESRNPFESQETMAARHCITPRMTFCRSVLALPSIGTTPSVPSRCTAGTTTRPSRSTCCPDRDAFRIGTEATNSGRTMNSNYSVEVCSLRKGMMAREVVHHGEESTLINVTGSETFIIISSSSISTTSGGSFSGGTGLDWIISRTRTEEATISPVDSGGSLDAACSEQLWSIAIPMITEKEEGLQEVVDWTRTETIEFLPLGASLFLCAYKLPWIPHTCYLGKERCQPHTSSCSKYREIRECCCDRLLIAEYKMKFSAGTRPGGGLPTLMASWIVSTVILRTITAIRFGGYCDS